MSGSFSSEMQPRDAVRTGWWMLWRGIWGLITRQSTITVHGEWT